MNKIENFFLKPNKKNISNFTRSFTFTTGDAGENHVGMQVIGKKNKYGLNNENMKKIIENLELLNIKFQFINLTPFIYNDYKQLFSENIEASIIVIRNLLSKEESDNIFNEQSKLNWNDWYYDIRRSKVLKKRRRHNLLYNNIGQESDNYKNGTIIAWNDVPYLKKGVDKLTNLVDEKINSLITEGNDYYDVNKKGIGIGYHGDTERSKVFAIKIGASMDLRFRWYYKHSIISEEAIITLNHGDAYIMSEKAVGTDWKKSSIPTLRHCSVPPGAIE